LTLPRSRAWESKAGGAGRFFGFARGLHHLAQLLALLAAGKATQRFDVSAALRQYDSVVFEMANLGGVAAGASCGAT